MLKINLTNEIYSKQEKPICKPIDMTLKSWANYVIKTDNHDVKCGIKRLRQILGNVVFQTFWLSLDRMKAIHSRHFKIQAYTINSTTQILKPKGE